MTLGKTIHASMFGVVAQTDAVQALLLDGQSLAQGANVSIARRNEVNRLDRAGVLMPGGLKRSDGLPVVVSGTFSLGYDETVSTSELVPAESDGPTPTGMYVAIALRLRRAALGLANPRVVFTFNGVSGQSADEFDDDMSLPTGSLGTLIHDKRGYWMEQLAAVSPGVVAPYAIHMQGQGDAAAAQGWYAAAMGEAWDDWLSQCGDIFGVTPIPCAPQIGGYVSGSHGGKEYWVCVEQVEIVEARGGIVLNPEYPVITGDNNVHPKDAGYARLADTMSFYLTEREAGRMIPSFRPTSATLIGNQLVLDYGANLRGGERLTFDTSGKYNAYGGCANQGFEVTGAAITSVTIGADHRTVVIDCDAPPIGWAYAMQGTDMSAFADGDGQNYGAHRGLLRKTAKITPVIADQTLYQWALSWRGALV
jgi:hypothetical protein